MYDYFFLIWITKKQFVIILFIQNKQGQTTCYFERCHLRSLCLQNVRPENFNKQLSLFNLSHSSIYGKW